MTALSGRGLCAFMLLTTFWQSSGVVKGLKVLHPFNQNIPSPLFNKFMGIQSIPANTTIVGEAVYVPMKHVCSTNSSRLHGRVVLVESNSDKESTLAFMREIILCAEAAGAIAVVRLFALNLAGCSLHLYDDHKRIGSFPVVAVSCTTPQSALLKEYATNSTSAVVEIGIDKSLWEEMWNSDSFFALAKVVIPAVNIVGIMFGIRAMNVHFLRQHPSTLDQRKSPTHSLHAPSSLRATSTSGAKSLTLMQIGCAIETVSFTLRLVSCMLDPLFGSTSIISTLASQSTTRLPAVLEIQADIVAALLFVHWDAFGISRTARVGLEYSLGILSVLVFGVQSYFIFLIGTAILSLNFIVVSVAVESLLIVVANAMFLWRGIRFLRQLQRSNKSLGKSNARNAIIARTMKWMFFSGIFQLLQACSALLLGILFSDPYGYMTAVSLYLLFSSFGGITRTMAFSPLRNTRGSAAQRESSASRIPDPQPTAI